MRITHAFSLLAALSLFGPALAAQDHQGMVMGFDQKATVHRFSLFTDGGAIEVSVKDSSDTKNRDAIRAHLPHIAAMFSEGNFEAPMLVHGSKDVPGTKIMAARRSDVRYEYVETKGGGRVSIVTTNPEALDAVHAFLTFQISDHKTGDSTAVRRR